MFKLKLTEFLRNPFKHFSIIDWTNLVFLIFIWVIFLFTFNKTPYRITLLFFYSGMFVYLSAFAFIRANNYLGKWGRLVQFMNPVIFFFTMFESFFMLLPFFNTNRYDALLDKIDIAILSVSPTIWIEQFAVPWLTETFYLFYVFYFPMPIIILGWMYKRKMFKEIEQSILVLFLCYYGGYISYFFIPAEGPRFFLQEAYAGPLDGLFLTDPIRQIIDIFEPNKLDVFPSLHAGILAVTMFISFKYNSRMFNWFIIPAIGISISLIYCRYHYFIDIIAGFALAALCAWLGPLIHDKLHSRFVHHFGEDEA